jgi:S-DNA-T family DNA segregation ATPase FtsK/SpoIIIE
MALKKKNELNKLFATFGLNAKVVDTIYGPTITKFIVKPAPGINLKKFENIHQNIKMVLETKEIRMELPIPGKALIGIEFANQKRELVTFFEVFKDIGKSNSPLPVALGKSIEGKSIILNIDETPHLLIAGATGSGKSIAVNTIIASIIMNKSPKDVRFVLIDPKFVEFTAFKNIPHLLAPIITDSKKASHDLNVLVEIMEARYKTMGKLGVRKLEQYNALAATKKLEH